MRRSIHIKRRYPVRRNVAGLDPWWHWLLEEKPPHVERFNLTTERANP
ncbi:hypothetical protein ACLBOM_21910 [Escherichia coli]